MRKTEDNKEYLQLKDILFMDNQEIRILDSIREKFFNYTRFYTLFSEREEEYIELDTKEEKEYISSKDFIYSKNDLDELDYNQLYEETLKMNDKIKQKFKEDVADSIDVDKDIDYIKMKYKYNSLVDYIKERIEKSCITCEAEDCRVDKNRKIGLDINGEPKGHNCFRYKNKLQYIKKHES